MARQNPSTFLKNLYKIITARPKVYPSLENNQLLNMILNRRSIRHFSDREIPDDVFNATLIAGIYTGKRWLLIPGVVSCAVCYLKVFSGIFPDMRKLFK
jgi:hypothetical protein